MKKIFTFLIILSTLVTNAQAPSYIPTDGLVGYWPFNSNANDESGNGNNGTVNGATLTTDRFGNNNSAYNFDGVNDYIRRGSISGLSQTNGITMSAWILWNGANGVDNHQYIFQIAANPNGAITISDTGNLSISVLNCNCVKDVSVSNVINQNTWYHVVLSYDLSIGTMKMYLNGKLIGTSQENMYTYYTVNNTPSGFGNYHFNSHYFKGNIDEGTLWNRALTQQEITNLYNASLPQTACLPANVPTNGLVGYWPFCGNANDESGNGNNGTVNGATLTTDRFGVANSAYSFNGNNNYIQSTCSNLPLGNSSRSISAWVNMSSLNNSYANFITSWGYGDASQTSANKAFGFLTALNGMWLWQSFSDSQNNEYFSTTSSPHNYYHVVVTVANNGLFKFFVNSILVYTNQIIGMNTISNGGVLRIGRSTHTNTDGWAGYFLGVIDDIGIWNRALSQEEITNLYNTNQCITNITVTDTLIINVGQLSFNEPVTWANNITIFPNPASTQININFNNITNLNGGTLKIINSLGQQVATTPITTSGTNSTMQLATWGGSGMYFVQIINSQGQIVDIKKIILQ